MWNKLPHPVFTLVARQTQPLRPTKTAIANLYSRFALYYPVEHINVTCAIMKVLSKCSQFEAQLRWWFLLFLNLYTVLKYFFAIFLLEGKSVFPFLFSFHLIRCTCFVSSDLENGWFVCCNCYTFAKKSDLIEIYVNVYWCLYRKKPFSASAPLQ